MKILHVINTLSIGGAEKLIIDSLPYFQKEVDQVDLVVLKKTDLTFDYKSLKDIKIKFLTNKSIYSIKLIFQIIPIIGKYDVLHLHLFPSLYWGVFAKLLSLNKVKVVFTEHSTSNRRRNNPIMRIVDKFVYSKLNFIGCISEGTKKQLIEHLGFRKQNIAVIYNGIDLTSYTNKISKISYNFFSEESFILIQVSSFRVQKDQETLIESLKLLPENFKLILVGDGPLRKVREEQVKGLGLEDRVLFLGIRSDIPQLLSYADVCILSSLSEGFGLAILEGMATSKPCIATNISGLNEIVKDYGLLFEVRSSNELAQHILKLASDVEFYNKIATQCFNRALEFDIKLMVKQYIKVYERILE